MFARTDHFPDGRQTLPYRIVSGLPFLSGVEFRPKSRLGRVSKDGSLESDDLMFWDVRPGLCRDVVLLAHQSF